MNSHNEDEKILRFGRKSFDVSNVAYGRIVKASIIWNDTISKEDVTPEEINLMSEKVGLFLIRQELLVLNRRFSKIKSIVEYLRRSLLTRRYINKSNKEEYEEFQDWVYFVLTGKKKESLEIKNGILEIIEAQVIEMTEKTNLNPEQCLELLRTLVADQMNPLIHSIADHEAS